MKLILASKSPRRKELLSIISSDYEVIVSDADETLEEGLTPEEEAKKISYLKAKTVFDKTSGDRIIIGSDTMVVKDGIIYGKPQDHDEAFDMLKTLRDTNHTVITGLAILVEKDGKYTEYIDYDSTEVYFTDYSDEEIWEWIKTGKADDKAGAYAVQGEFMVHIKKIDGNYSTVMGLPIHMVYKELKKYLEL